MTGLSSQIECLQVVSHLDGTYHCRVPVKNRTRAFLPSKKRTSTESVPRRASLRPVSFLKLLLFQGWPVDGRCDGSSTVASSPPMVKRPQTVFDAEQTKYLEAPCLLPCVLSCWPLGVGL